MSFSTRVLCLVGDSLVFLFGQVLWCLITRQRGCWWCCYHFSDTNSFDKRGGNCCGRRDRERENKRMCSRCCCCGALYCIAPPSELSSLFCGPRCYYDTATEEGESRLLCAGRGDVTSQQLVHGHMRFEASSNDDVGSFTCSVQHPKWNFVLSFSLFLSFFMKGRTKGIIKEQQAKGNLEHFFSFSSFSSSLSAKCITYWWYNLKDTSYTSSRDCFWLSTAGKCNSARGGMKDAGAEAAMMPVYII